MVVNNISKTIQKMNFECRFLAKFAFNLLRVYVELNPNNRAYNAEKRVN